MTSEGSGKGANFVVTRLIPELKFTCRGTIVQFTLGGVLIRSGVHDPKIQIWRERESQCGAYFKSAPDIALNRSVCDGMATMVSSGVYRCTLKEAFRVSVQPNDILGLELPSTDNGEFELYFKDGGPTNYVFNNQVLGTVVLSSRTKEVQEQPQINITVDSETILSPGTDALTHFKTKKFSLCNFDHRDNFIHLNSWRNTNR